MVNLFQTAINLVLSCIAATFDWFDRVFDSMPGAWITIFSFITILVIQRFLLKPLGFGSASDTVSRIRRGKSDKVRNRDSQSNSGG